MATEEFLWDGKSKRISFGSISLSFLVSVNPYALRPSGANPKLYLSSLWLRFSEENYKPLLPITFQINILGTKRTYKSTIGKVREYDTGAVVDIGTIRGGTVGSSIAIPADGNPFDIEVTITPKAGSGYDPQTVTYSACGVMVNAITKISRASDSTDTAVTNLQGGTIYKCWFRDTVRAGEKEINGITEYYINRLNGSNGNLSDGFVDAYTPIEDAEDDFSSCLIIPEGDPQEDQTMVLIQYTNYVTADFEDDEIQISTVIKWDLNYLGGGTADQYMKPVVTADDFEITGTPCIESTQGDIAYVSGISEMNILLKGGKFPYGGSFMRMEVSWNGSRVQAQNRLFTGTLSSMSSYGQILINENVTVRVYESRGGYTQCTLKIPKLAYSPPSLYSFTVHRCTLRSSGSSTSDYVDSVTGKRYIPDDFGDKCAIITTVQLQTFTVKNGSVETFTPEIQNSGGIVVTPDTETPQGYQYSVGGSSGIPITDYKYCKVIDADIEKSFNVIAKLSDMFYYDEEEGGKGTSNYSKRVSTAGVLMDFKSGGKGVGIGRVASEDKMVDVGPDWTMRAYNIVIGNYEKYRPSGYAPVAAVDTNLLTWMKSIEATIARLQNSSSS